MFRPVDQGGNLLEVLLAETPSQLGVSGLSVEFTVEGVEAGDGGGGFDGLLGALHWMDSLSAGEVSRSTNILPQYTRCGLIIFDFDTNADSFEPFCHLASSSTSSKWVQNRVPFGGK